MLGEQVDEATFSTDQVGPWMFLGDNVPTVFAYGAFDLITNTDLEGKPRLVGGFQEFFRKGFVHNDPRLVMAHLRATRQRLTDLVSNGQLPA